MTYNDTYGSTVREAMKKSMEEPWKPINRIKREKRRIEMFFEITAWIIALTFLTAFATGTWFLLNFVEQKLR